LPVHETSVIQPESNGLWERNLGASELVVNRTPGASRASVHQGRTYTTVFVESDWMAGCDKRS
jgi:hypothetical protein